MLREVLLYNLILCPMVILKRYHEDKSDESSGELGASIITSLRNDANLDLPMDEEYEDLRAELLAYHTALASLTEPRADIDPNIEDIEDPTKNVAGTAPLPDNRRSMKSTPCWQLRGICVNYKLCKNHRYLSEVDGCKDNSEVCCFTWNTFETRDLRDKGVSNHAFPWGISEPVGGKGIIEANDIRDSGLKDVHIPYIPVFMQGQAILDAKKKENKISNKHLRNNKKASIVVIVKQNKI